MEFNQLPTVQKGYMGEAEVDKYLIGKGIVPYSPITGVAHPFDRLCASQDKKRIFIAECKAKASRSRYPDTGINLSSYQDYKNIMEIYKIDVWLFFVDEYLKKIYGNSLSELEKPREIIIPWRGPTNYPLIDRSKYGKDIIYFPLVAMIDVCEIDPQIALKLRQLSTRNYEYSED
jgi:hypothetical protein